MLFQHNWVSPAFLEGKKLKSQITAKELKLDKQNTDPHSQKWVSVNFLFDPLNFLSEKKQKNVFNKHILDFWVQWLKSTQYMKLKYFI